MALVKPDRRVAGRLERLAYERMARDRERLPALGYTFDEVAADRIVTFLEEFCRHHKGEWAGKPLTQERWQKDVWREVFGWKRPDGTRRFRTVYIELARKNGKTEEAGGIGLYLLVADGEPGAEVYCSATKEDQAKILFDVAVAMRKQSPELVEVTDKRQKAIVCHELGSVFKPLGADSNTLDGLNPHGNIVDELHAHKDPHVYNVLTTAMGARRQPLTVVITTAGLYEPESIGWQQHQYAVRILERVIEDETFFAFITAADEGDDWKDPVTWWKANPNLGVSVKWSYLEELAARAGNEPSFLNTFLRYHLNIWTQQQERWIPIDAWNACDADRSPEAFASWEETLVDRTCYAGLDLSSKLDLTALVLVFPPVDGDGWAILPRFWVPAERILERARKDRVPYDAWARDGWLRTTSGNVIDYDAIRAEVVALASRYRIQEIAFDPWNATQTAIQLGGEGLTAVEMRQGFASLSEPSKEFEKLVIAGAVRHGGHPVMRWMVNNVAKREDPAGNIKPDKAASADRIDGVVAAIMAIGRATLGNQTSSVYEQRGLLWV